MSNLKPCPFCGGVAKLKAPGYEHYSPCWVKCTQCGAEGPTKSSEEKAEKGWNERAQEDKWIPVKEKLPDKDGRYLVCDGGAVLEACFSPTGQLRRNQNGEFYRLPSWSTTDCYESEDLDHVTHWMPLPEPPEGE
jgi:Lar family restriction alleviation protein